MFLKSAFCSDEWATFTMSRRISQKHISLSFFFFFLSRLHTSPLKEKKLAYLKRDNGD